MGVCKGQLDSWLEISLGKAALLGPCSATPALAKPGLFYLRLGFAVYLIIQDRRYQSVTWPHFKCRPGTVTLWT